MRLRVRGLAKRRLRPMCAVVVDGRVHVLRSVCWGGPDGWHGQFEPLGDALACNIVVGPHSRTLAEALVDAGWTPPSP